MESFGGMGSFRKKQFLKEQALRSGDSVTPRDPRTLTLLGPVAE